MKSLTLKQALFVKEYVKHGNGKRAAIDAGYTATNAIQTASELLRNNPVIKQAIEEAKNSLREGAKYNYEKAMAEADACIEFARQTENANAMVKAMELKAKLTGLLVEKLDVRQVGFQINISGIHDGK